MSIRLKDPSNWKKSSTNRWCDLIELYCLYKEDHFCSSEDALEIVYYKSEEYCEIEKAECHAETSDIKIRFVEDLFLNLQMRKNILGELYPFEVTRNTIELSAIDVMEENSIYVFLLLCSNLCFVDKPTQDKITKEFEICSYYAMKKLISDKFSVHVFGTSRVGSIFEGNVRQRIEILAKLLNTRTSFTFAEDKRFDVPGGDAGVDIIAFSTIDNESFIPLIMAQCACGYDDWKSKQYEINEDIWNKVFDNLAPYIKMMFVPFMWRENNGEFLNKTEISTCLVDRLRLMQLLYKETDYKEYSVELTNFIKDNGLDSYCE